MPFYEYECSNCKFYVEALQKISDPPLKKCPSCKKQTMKKLVSAPVFRLKGAGWYETDFKSDQEGKRNLAGADEAPAEDAKPDKADTKGEAKPDTKPESKSEAKSDAKPEPRSERRTDSKKAGAKGKASTARPKAKAKARPRAKPAKKKARR